MTRIETILHAYQDTVTPLLQFIQPRNSCITQSRITMEVLRRLNVKAQAICTSLVVEIPDLRWAYISGFNDEERARMKAAATKFGPHPAYNDTDEGWRGHVCVLAAGRFLVDTSLDQASSPGHGITIPPDVMVVPIEEYTPGRTTVEVCAHLQTGKAVKITYYPKKDSSYKTSDAWKFDRDMAEMVAIVTAHVLEAVSAAPPKA